MANASPEIAQLNETQRAETAANKFYDMAEKRPGAKDPKAREMFSIVGRETADGGYDRAQRILESGAQWDDTLRGAASEVNQLDQEKRGAKPMSLEDAVGTMSRYAEELQNTGSPEDALEVQKIAAGMTKTGQEGVEASERALQYIEGLQKSQVDRMSQRREIKGMDTLQSLQEKRGIRDALHQEKQKRVEQMKQSQRGTEDLTKGRESTTRGLEKLYADAGMPEGTASRQEFFGRVSAMSSEELHFLDSALNKAAREAMRSGDPKMLEGLLVDLSTKSFKLKDVEARQKAEDQRKIEEIRRKMGLPEQQPAKPSGRSEAEIEASRKKIEEMMPLPKRETKTPPPIEVGTKPREQESRSEKPVYEKITDKNFEQYRQQKEVTFDGKAWKIDSITPDGRIALQREITMEEAVSLAERAKKGEVGGNVDTPNVKGKRKLVSKGELESGGQWIVERPPRSPQNSERQKEVDAVKVLQARLTSKEFAGSKSGEKDLLMDIFERDAQRLNQEWQDYERSTGKK